MPGGLTLSRHLVLVSLDILREKDPRTSLGHASHRARLSEVEGLEVSPVCMAVNQPSFREEDLAPAILARIDGRDTDIAFGVYAWNDAIIRHTLPVLRENGFSGRIFLGGPQISYAEPGVASLYPEADAIIRGYAEDALARVVASRDPLVIDGVAWQGGPDAALPAAIDIDSLPSPYLTGILTPTPFIRWETQRGCLYACAFCQHRAYGRGGPRPFPLPRIRAEIGLFTRSGVRDIAALDPIFHAHPHAPEILRTFRAHAFSGRLSLQCRFERITPEFLDACEGLDVRLEFGLQTIHRSEMAAIGRINDLGRVEAVMADLARRGIFYEVSVIFGLPTQTVDAFRSTLSWCRDRGAPVIKAFPLQLLRGTRLHRDRARWGLVESADPIPVVLASDTFGRAAWEEMRRIADEEAPTAP